MHSSFLDGFARRHKLPYSHRFHWGFETVGMWSTKLNQDTCEGQESRTGAKMGSISPLPLQRWPHLPLA